MKWIPRLNACAIIISLLLILFSKSEKLASGIIFFIFFSALFLYLLPSYIAILREIESIAGPIIVNLFFGWSIIGWVIALIWASTNRSKNDPIRIQVISDQGLKYNLKTSDDNQYSAKTKLISKQKNI